MTPLDHRDVRPADADVIVVGAGINGLTCATLLAQARFRVLVLEARDRTGGFCATGEIIPGFRAPLYSHWTGPVDLALVKPLKLQKFGLELLQQRLGAVALSPDGHHILLDSHARRGTGGLAQHSQTDARTWAPFEAAMRKLASGLGAVSLDMPLRAGAKGGPAPRIRQDDGVKTALASLAIRTIASLVEEYFEAPRLQGALALEAIVGTGLGPRTPGSALTWIERLAPETQRHDTAMWFQGGPGAFSQALTQAAQAAGVNFRFNARIEDVVAQSGRVEGVVLAGGEALYAPKIVSSIGPSEVLGWPGARRASPPGSWDQARGASLRHGLAKVHFALRGLPQFKGLDAKDLRARLLFADSLDAVETAFDAACRNQMPDVFPMEAIVPSAFDATLAPKDGHVLSALLPFVPISPREGWREARNKLTLQTIATLSRYAPDLPNRVLSAEVETPETMAQISPLEAMHWRRPGNQPLHDLNPYGCALEGLFFCGAVTHPRLGASGLNGRNCAEAILALHPYEAPA